jgi:acid-sensing ion channel, other
MDVISFEYGLNLEVLITPEIVRTDENLKRIDPKTRGCYFPGERRLKYFKFYSRKNCEFECISDRLMNDGVRNCIPFFIARDEVTKTCDYRYELETRGRTLQAMENISHCGCLDECNSINYKIEIIEHNVLFSNFEASIEFSFKDIDVVPLRRYQPITFSDFLAQSGGMMGLFAGISALSIIEVFYFMTIRWMVNLWRWFRK